MKKDLKLYLRLLGYIRPYWRVVLISIVAMVVSAAMEPVLPALMQPLIDKSLIQRNGASLWQVPVFIMLAFVLKGIADYVANVASQTVAQKTIADLRALIFSHQLDLPIARHRAEEGGRMLSRITYDTSMVGEAVSTAWLTIIRDTLVLIGLLGFLFYTAWQLTLLVLLITPALALAIRRINGRLRQSNARVQDWMGRVTGLVEEALLGLQEIKIFGAHRSQDERFTQANQGLRREQMRVVRVQAINVPLVQVLAACSVALVIYVASSLNRQDLLTPGEFVAFITAMSMVFEPVRRLTNVNAILQRGLAAAESLFKVLDELGELNEGGNKNSSSVTQVRHPTCPKPVSLELRSITYKYPTSPNFIFQNFNLTIEAGHIVALVGESGTGKTSLLNLLCGLEKPLSGQILIDRIDAATLPINKYRENIALVSQQVFLFGLTVAENLRLACPNASKELLIDALRMADAIDFVESLPNGIDTHLGHKGAGLSGGAKATIIDCTGYSEAGANSDFRRTY